MFRSPAQFLSAFRPLLAALMVAVCGTRSTGELSQPAHTKVVIVCPSGVVPFKDAAIAFVESLPAGTPTETLTLEQATEAKLEQFAGSPGTRFLAVGTEAAKLVHKAVPEKHRVVAAMVADPVGAGLLDQQAVSIVSMDVPCVAQAELISQVLPKARTVGVIYDSRNARGARTVEALRSALPKDWKLSAVDVSTKQSVSDAIDALLETSIDVVWTYPDSKLYDSATVRVLLQDSLRRKIPVFGFSVGFVRAGALIGVGIAPADQGRQAARLLEESQTTTNDKDIVQAPDFKVYFNSIVAEKFGVTLPPTLISSAADVSKGE